MTQKSYLQAAQAARDGLAIDSYGGVVVSGGNKVLLREAAKHHAGYVWTFAKTLTERGESPQETAIRAVREKTGYEAEVRLSVPGIYKGSASTSGYFILDARHPPRTYNWQTTGLRWVELHEAAELLSQTSNREGRARDLAVLDAVKRSLTQIPYRDHLNVHPEDFWEPLARLSERQKTLHPHLHFTAEQMTRIRRGFYPTVMEQKWFVYFTDDRLKLHRSWTGNLCFDVGFNLADDGSARVSEVLVDLNAITIDDDEELLQTLQDCLRHLLLEPLEEPAVDGFVLALQQAAKPDYLGSPEVVGGLLQTLIDVCVRLIANEADDDDMQSALHRVVFAFADPNSSHVRMPGWHTAEQLGNHIKTYLLGGQGPSSFANIVRAGLEAFITKLLVMLKDFIVDPRATWEADALPQLNALHRYGTEVFLGTNTQFSPKKKLSDFAWIPVSN